MKVDKTNMEFKLEADLTKLVKEYLQSIPDLDSRFDKLSDRYHPGISDFVGCYKGWFVAIELKSATGVPTVHQVKYLTDMAQAGGKVLLATKLQQVIDFINSIERR